MPTENKVFTKLFSDKTKLSKKVALGTVKEDIDFYINYIEDPKSKAEQIVSDMKSLGDKMQGVLSELQTLLPEAKETLQLGYRLTGEIDDVIERARQSAEKLGIDPAAIGNFTELEEIAKEDFFYFKDIEDAWWTSIKSKTDQLSDSEDLFR
tara:strand:+ start:1428 stop:1883 length:456 start_codon:yes stop_codon:yes gene_type:complete